MIYLGSVYLSGFQESFLKSEIKIEGKTSFKFWGSEFIKDKLTF